ncbi:efflux RND transporter periplasmic adaptor subunit [Chitinophaga cymbidii]|uniref:Uncharacterized protein n=1 Tax=Chitinophaga cymbidii TaxID=1096750 RepID=A0A512RP45_9BACT|nr:efflux RND transporter periplasmic adaptor subunit [Chitinophaga cymbidii]GEP97473.1 hypothetical protein CCY01nite_37330 [Chitinophaga cymbidii]
MGTYFFSILLLIFLAGWSGCKQRQEQQTEAVTFVLSDTMMASVCIDTTIVRPVEGELRLRGTVAADRIWITADVPDSDVFRLKAGNPVEVTAAGYPDQVFKGRIGKVYNRQVRIRLSSEGMQLRPETPATVVFRYREDRQMPAIPSSAVIFDKGRSFVMVFRDKYNVHTREVQVSGSLNDVSYISKGLRPGDKVISRNQLVIYHALNSINSK